MKTIKIFAIVGLLTLTHCKSSNEAQQTEQWKAEVIATEKQFNALAQNEGLAEAFNAYAAPDGVIRRGKSIIQGPSEISTWYANEYQAGESLTWSPDFVDVSQSGDMAYTYGTYVFSRTDSTGTTTESTGIFHTVWKRQPDGEWRFVWD